jgi:hypothetical protein
VTQDDDNADTAAGEVLRPQAIVLGDDALVPDGHMIRPPPNRFTHELTVDAPYHFDRPQRTGEPDGVLPAGTRVVALVEGPDSARVVDGNGLYVEVQKAGLRKLPDS